nr:MAG: RNA-dependent RNA polymerase [Mitovirus sp.]
MVVSTYIKYMKIQINGFHTSNAVGQNNNHPLFKKINWEMVAAGNYAVVNPAPGGQAILYVSHKEMNKMVRVALSQDTSLIILASPGDQAPDSDQSSSTSPFTYKNSPRVGALLPHSMESYKNWARSPHHGYSHIDESGNILVTVTEQSLSHLIEWWGINASFRAGGPLTSSDSLKASLRTIALELSSLLRHNGPQYVIMRMKVTLFLMYRRLAEQPGQNAWLLGIPVGLATCKLPKIIPLPFRRRILKGDLAAIRIMGTVFSAYKVLEGTHKVSDLSTVTSTCPELNKFTLEEFQNFCEKDFWRIVAKHAGKKRWTSLEEPNFRFPQQASYLADRKQLWSSLGKPNLAVQPTDKRFIPFSAGPNHSVGLLGAPFDAIAWSQQPINWPLEWANAVGDTDTIALFNRTMKQAQKLPSKFQEVGATFTGKLQLLPEPAGKVRSIAIVDYWTQRLMHPVHKWMMDILKCLPTDATFDQEGSLKAFAEAFGKDTVYSIDLKSATDMIPQCLYTAVLKPIIGEKLSMIWISLMTDRDFHVKKPMKGPGGRLKRSLFSSSLWGKSVRYNRGQPMGTLSSWASMALVHHAIELFSAKKAGIDPFTFLGYRILGDDNVTANESVANMYLRVTEELQVPTSPPKTMVGRVFSFASQYFMDSVNISPISVKEEEAITTTSQRVEFALRSLRRGWCSVGTETSIKMSRFLRSLLSIKDYISSVKEWNKGALGGATQAALIVSLGNSMTLLKSLGYQATGCETLLLAIANRVEALGGNQGNLGSGFEEPMGEFNIQFALSAIMMIAKEGKRVVGSLTTAAQDWQKWCRGLDITGFLPRSSRMGPRGKLLSNIPFPEDRDVVIAPAKEVVDTDIGMVRKMAPVYMAQYFTDHFYSEEFAMRTGQKFDPKVASLKKKAHAGRLEEISQLHRAIWPVIEEVYTPLFGDPRMDMESFPVYLGKDPVTNLPKFGFAEPAWKHEVDEVVNKLQQIMDEGLALGTDADSIIRVWELVSEAVDVVAGVSMPPTFKSLKDLEEKKTPLEKSFGVEWVRRTQLIQKVLRMVPLGSLPFGPRVKTVKSQTRVQGTVQTKKPRIGLPAPTTDLGGLF